MHDHAFSDNLKLQQQLAGNPSQMIRLTIAAVPNGSQMFWCVLGLRERVVVAGACT